jgi:hypothetical protein
MAFATVCLHPGARHTELLRWADWDEAREALAVLFDVPCSRRCQGDHLAVTRRDGVWGVAMPQPPAPSLAEELRALYPRRTSGATVAVWATPRELNEPLGKPVIPSMTGSRIRNGQKVALARALAQVAL